MRVVTRPLESFAAARLASGTAVAGAVVAGAAVAVLPAFALSAAGRRIVYVLSSRS
jgi:hypothetical protein